VTCAVKEIFDTARDRTTAARWLRGLRREAERLGLDLAPFFATYDRWKTEILNYFDARQTSAAVEGINNKARVITKRTYGLKSAQSLWNRLILDLNRASEAIGWSIDVSGGTAKRAIGVSSKLISDKSPGTFRPRSRATSSVASDILSLLAMMAVGGSPSPSRTRAHTWSTPSG